MYTLTYNAGRACVWAVDKTGFCHCETVTDVTVVAIRIPRKPRDITHFTGERIPTPVCALARNDALFALCLHIEHRQSLRLEAIR